MPEWRIVYIHANNDEPGGADYCLLKMALAAREAGYAPLTILRRRTPIIDLYLKNDLPVRILPILRIQKTNSLLKLLGYLFHFPASVILLWKALREHKADLVHANDLLDFPGLAAARLLGVPACQHIRMIVERPAWLKTGLAHVSLLLSNRVLCVSNAVKHSLYPGSHPKVRVVYDWLDMETAGHTRRRTSIRAELGLGGETRLVGCIGRLEEWKGQHIFLQAAQRLAAERPDIHFIIVGGPVARKEGYAQALQEAWRRGPGKERITFLGPREDMANLMQALDVAVHASIAPDPLPGVVMEAAHNGCIVVGANAGGVPEEICDGETGFLYRPGGAGDMAAKILLALDSPDRERMRARAVEFVDRKFDKEAIAGQLISIYREMLGQGA